jgi:hypothetical protein
MEDNSQAGQDMNCTECNGKVRKLDKKAGGWICIALGLMAGLRLDPDWSLRFAGSAYLWLIIFVVPGFMLLRAKPRYNYWCSHCKKMVSAKKIEKQ